MADFQAPLLLVNHSPSVSDSSNHRPLPKLTRFQWWILVLVNILFLILGQATAVLLTRYYYDKGGNSKWTTALAQTVAFPALLIPYVILRSLEKSPTLLPSSRPSILKLVFGYLLIGTLLASDGMIYSHALSYLPASTYSLICATQLAFMAIFLFFINHQKITFLILNSTVLVSLSTALLAVNGDNTLDEPTKKGYIIGVFFALGDAAMYSLVLSLIQLMFQRVVKKGTITAILEVQLGIAVVAVSINVVGLFVSGEWSTLSREMQSFSAGKVSYVMTVVGMAAAWLISNVGTIVLICSVSSLFSNVISMLALAIIPIASLIVFHDPINGVKIIAMLLAFWGTASYLYQNYLDDRNARRKNSHVSDASDIEVR